MTYWLIIMMVAKVELLDSVESSLPDKHVMACSKESGITCALEELKLLCLINPQLPSLKKQSPFVETNPVLPAETVR